MPEFRPGETKTARATMRNPTAKAFDYTGFLYMGTDLAVMSEVSFSLNAGQEEQVLFPVTMPSAQGTYPVHIGVFSAGQSIALYRATEDISIIQAPTGVYSRITKISAPASATIGQRVNVEVTVKNLILPSDPLGAWVTSKA